MYNFSAITGVIKHLKVRRLFACVLLLAVVGTATSRGQPATPADLTQIRARADKSDPEAQNALGNVYANGLLGVKVDPVEAFAWYQKAAQRGYAPAQFNLGLAYEGGRGVAADDAQAFKYYLLAAEQGFGPAQFNVGNMYSTGRGVAQDLFEANLWYKQAADKGLVEAQFNLGLGYEAGRGVKKDEAQAARWYKIAADRGFARAQYNYGLLLEDGRGVAKNELAAASYYRAAAEQGFASAQNNYGVMLSEGRPGVPKDLPEAFVWLSLAAENGANPAARDFVSRALSADQLVAANRLLAERRGGRAAPAAAPSAGATAPRTAVEASPASRPADPALSARVAELTAELERTRAANSRYEDANQRLEVEKTQLTQQLAQSGDSGKLIEQLRDQSRRLAGQVEALTIEKDLAQREVAVLGVQLKDAQTDATRRPATPSPEALAETAKLRAELTALSAQLAQATTQLNEQRQANQKLTQANAALQREKTAASGPARVATTGAVDERYPLQDSDKDAIIAGLQRDVVRLNDEVKRSTRELTAVNLQLRSLRNQPATSATPAKPDAAIAELTTKADQAVQDASRLQAENARLAARIAELEKLPKPTPTDPTLAPRLAEAEQELKNLAGRLATENFNLKTAQARVTELEKQLAAVPQPSPERASELEQLRTELAAAKQQASQSATRLADLALKNQQLEIAASAARSEGEKNIAQVRAQVDVLQTELASARAAADGLASARQENEKLTARISELERQPKSAIDDTLPAKLAAAEQSVASLQQQLRALQAEKNELEQWSRTLEQNQQEKATQAAAVSAEAQALKEKLGQAEKQIATVSSDLAAQQAAVDKLTAENTTLSTKAQQDAKAGADALAEVKIARQQLLAEKERAERWMKSSQSMTEKAAEENMTSRRLQTALAEAQAKLVQTEKSIAENATQIAALTSDLTRARASVEQGAAAEQEAQKLRAVASNLPTLQQENARLAARVAELENQPKPVVDETLAPRLSEAQKRLAGLEGELRTARESASSNAATVADLRQQLASAQASLTKTTIKADESAANLATVRAENQRLAAQVAQLENQPKADESLAPRLQVAQEKVAALEADLRAQQAEVARRTAEVSTLQGQLTSAAATVSKSNSDLVDAAAVAETARRDLETTKAQLVELQKELYTAKQTAATANVLRSENMRLSGRIADLENQVKAAALDAGIAEQLASAQTKIRTLETELSAAREATSAHTESSEALKTQLAKNAEILAQAQQAVTMLQRDLAEARQSATEAAALRAEVATLRATASEAATLREENTRLASRVEELAAKPAAVADPATAEQLTQAQRQLRLLTDKAASDRTNYIQAQARIATLEADVRILQRQNSGGNGEFEAVKKQLAESNAALEKSNGDLIALQEEIVKVRQSAADTATVRDENARLQARVNELENQPKPVVDDTLAPRLAQAQQKIVSLEADLKGVRQQAAEAGATVDDLQKQLSELQKAGASAASLQSENTRLVTKIAELEKRPQADPTLSARLAEAQQAARVAGERVVALETQLDSARQGGSAELEALKRQLAAATQSLEKSQANVAELTALNSQLEKQALELKEGVQKDLQAARDQVTTLEQALAVSKQEAGQAATLREEAAQLRTVATEAATLRDENSRLTARVRELQNQPKPAPGDPTFAPRLAQAQSRITALENELHNARQDAVNLEEVKKQLEEANQALEKSSASVAELTALNDRLVQDVAAARESAQRELTAARGQVTTLQTQLNASREAAGDSAALREELTKLRTEATGLATLRSENERLRAAAADTQALRTRLEQLTRDNEQLTSFMTGNRADLDKAQARVALLEKQIADARTSGTRGADEVRKLQTELTEANQSVEKLNATVAELTGTNDRLEQDLENAKKAVSAALAAQAQALSATQPDAYKMEIATLTGQIKELEAQMEEDRGNAAKEFASLASQLQRARETNRSLSEANRSLMSARQSEIPTVNKDEFDRVQARVNDLVAVGDELRRQNQKLTEDNQRFVSEQATLKEQLEDARKVATVLPGLADEKAALQERLEAVATQLATAQREIDTLQKTSGDTAAQLLASQQAAERAQTELAAFRTRAAEAEKAAETHNLSVAELTDLNTKLEAERDDLRKQIVAARAEATRLAQSASTVEQLKADADRSAQQNLDALSAQLAQVRRELQTARDINTRIVETNTAQERERAAALTQLRQENSALASRLAQAQGTLDQIASAARLATPASVLASGGSLPPAPQTSSQAAPAQVRYHTVVEGDSLSRISLRYYGTGNRWQEIFQANRDVLQGSSTLRVGMQLRIP